MDEMSVSHFTTLKIFQWKGLFNFSSHRTDCAFYQEVGEKCKEANGYLFSDYSCKKYSKFSGTFSEERLAPFGFPPDKPVFPNK